MNPRVLTLIKSPESIQREDLEILSSSITEFPYIQNIRALHLMGIHQFHPELYQQELSKTAAYTTDKKILYHLINKKQISEVQNSTVLNDIPEEKPVTDPIEEQPLSPEITTPKPVEIDGVVNRILFEGEENFWEMDHQTIDMESTIESGKLVTQKKSLEENVISEKVENRILETQEVETFSSETIIPAEKIEEKEEVIKNPAEKSFQEIPELTTEETQDSPENMVEEISPTESFSTETIVNETEISEAENIVEDPSQVSFHGSQEFLPNVKITSANPSKEIQEAPKKSLNKHEEEMQRLIAEVEEKMKLMKRDREKEPETIQNNDINFSEMQEMEPEIETKEEESIPQPEPEDAEPTSRKEEIKSDWKPMDFSGNSSSFRDKKFKPEKETFSETEETVSEIEETVSEPEEIKETEKTEERPALNVSFFAPETRNISPKKEENIEAKAVEKLPEISESEKSNFPKFLDTWQNWLKIDRKVEIEEEIPPVDQIEVKNNIIENFIQKEPRISKLKEESDFVFKERDGNISHLMTETLASLYLTQKLYAKAIKAYEILGEKHPEKKEYFLELVQKTKDLRKNS